MKQENATHTTESRAHRAAMDKFRRKVDSLTRKGYEMLLPSEPSQLATGSLDAEQQLSDVQCLGGRAVQGSFAAFESQQSHPLSTPSGVGTPSLGYIPWGPQNRLPNTIFYLDGAQPYTSAGNKYIIDLTVGGGPAFVYRFVYYRNGVLHSEVIPFEDAGTLILGRIGEVNNLIAERNRQQEASQQAKEDDGSEDSGSDDGSSSARSARSEDPNRPPQDGETLTLKAGDEPRPQPGTLEYELEDLQRRYQSWKTTLEEYLEFTQNNDVALHYQKCVTDDVHMDIYFPTLGLSRGRSGEPWAPKIVRLGFLPCVCSRFEEMDPQLRINYVYYCEKWRLDATAKIEAKDMVAYPALMPENRLNKLRKVVSENASRRPSARPLWFCAPCYQPSMLRPYYPQPAWWSIFPSKVYEYASTLITDKATARQNSTMWGKMIFIHNEYLRSLFDAAGADTTEEKEKVRNSIYMRINNFLKNRENGGKSICLDMFPAADNKTMQYAVQIVDVPTVSNASEMKDELEEISSIIFFAIGINPSLVGAVPGKSGSTGGTYQRELTLLKQNQLSSRQRTYLKLLNDIRDFNGWDHNAFWVIRQQVLTTLDRNATGVEDSDSY
jgi:hypothetical protein